MPKLLTHPHKGVQQLLMLCTVIYAPDVLARDFDVDTSYGFAASSLSRLPSSLASIVVVGDTPQGLKASDLDTAILRAVENWNSVPCSTARLEFRGHKEISGLSAGDIVVRFADPETEECLPDGFLGFTVGCRGNRTVLLSTSDVRWSTAPSPYDRSNPLIVDTTAVITHEFGHVLGLGHDDEDARNTMTTRYLSDGGQASLSAADKLALCEIYPSGVSECTINSDCLPGRPCVRRNGDAVCDDERGDPGDYCGAELLICPFACEISSPATQSGYCTTPCEQASDCATNMVCVDQQCSIPNVVQSNGCQTGTGFPLWWSITGLLLWWRRSPRTQRTSE